MVSFLRPPILSFPASDGRRAAAGVRWRPVWDTALVFGCSLNPAESFDGDAPVWVVMAGLGGLCVHGGSDWESARRARRSIISSVSLDDITSLGLCTCILFTSGAMPQHRPP